MKAFAPLAAFLLASCGSGAEEADRVTTVDLPGNADDAEPAPPPMPGPTADDLALLESRDCRTVAQAYADAIYRKSFPYAAMFWHSDAADEAALEQRYGGYGGPRFIIAQVMEEGAAGSLYCTVTGALTDTTQPDRPAREGEIVLRRANDVPGASAEQLRWTIRSSTLAEPGERAGEGDPA